ncbi:MAG: hypothetical protein ACRETN_03095 [Nevskiales bacterium]
MLTPINIVIALNLAALLILVWRFARLQRLGTALAVAAAPIVPPPTSPPELEALLAEGRRMLISIEILNPMQLAAKESWFASVFGTLSPALIKKIVNERTQKMLETQLKDYGVEADVRLHRA